MDIIEAIHADLVAIRRAYIKGGKRLAIVELHRRWPAITDNDAPIFRDRILSVPINAGLGQTRRDSPP